MYQMKTRLFLVCLGLLLFFRAAHAQDDEFELQCISNDQFIRIYSDHTIDQTRCKSIANTALKAYAFVSKQDSWSNTIPLVEKPLDFRLVREFDKHTLLGYAQGTSLMAAKDNYLNNTPVSEGTLAHEFTHIQDNRQLKRRKLPSFLMEGRASINGHAYRMSLGHSENKFDRQMAGTAMRFTSSEADDLLSDYHGRGWKNQAIGAFLVEYMRTKWNGSGISDINKRLSRMIEIMAKGSGFETAFQEEFGVTFDAFRATFIRYLDDTQNEPRTRLQQTMWQSANPLVASDRSDESHASDE
ncbi:hypothetical protein F6R98_05535 [Candidatus Methylospira mobilis]|uniref:Peptidase MA-like domain-containing protein n=1 Tax=Candidatus Methylospira mobilis TaxID=1808979 RepID=A0A5Q0BEB6_9GAMM|nr:hypothetical protein [Candidatus Methylospira mobilis]QFY42160.1 hypothetical protein F6R98_05535 [Candidatus Methylospira mobilis]WNV03174.1 hypothetical protein RP726_11910 [Candidatus Methylospira mobilis]